MNVRTLVDHIVGREQRIVTMELCSKFRTDEVNNCNDDQISILSLFETITQNIFPSTAGQALGEY